MAMSSLNTKIGPTNADIATAVAAPSAATIAAAVAAPSAATIASAVAAPSASTIATAVAAAVPTISAINTAVANNAPSANNWTLINSIAMAGANTYTFSSISGYKALRLYAPRLSRLDASGTAGVWIRLNGDTNAANYTWSRITTTASASTGALINAAANSYFGEGMYFNAGNGGVLSFDYKIENANSTSVPKTMYGTYQTVANSGSSTPDNGARGNYLSTSAITSITIFAESTSTFTGSPIYLLGAN